MGWASAASGPFDRFKLTVGEGGIRVPLLIAGPGVKGGRKTDAFAYVIDLMPTILEMAGLAHPQAFRDKPVAPMRGRSLVSLLSGADDSVYGPDVLVGGEMLDGKWMRQGNFKAVSVASPYGPATWKLFDLSVDPGETTDLSRTKANKLVELRKAWDAYAKDVGVVPRGY